MGFVTSKTYARVTGSRAKKKNVWITDDVTDTVIGADPEFLLFDDDGNVVRANNVMGYQGVIGCDGAMAEVRPAPQISPEGLMENIRKIFADKELTKEIRKYRWTAGCYHKDQNRDYPMGGHIHIGNPVKLARMDMDVRSNFFVGFNKVLDELLALPMVKIDGSKLGRARRSECAMGKYGYFGEFRTCNGRLEHRTLSGMWLMHPELSILVFGTAKAIIDEVFSHVAHNKFSRNYLYSDIAGRKDIIWRPGFKDWERIPIVRDMGCLKPSDTMVEILNDSKAEKITMPFLREWYAKMRTLGTYKKYARYIDGLFEVLKIKQKSFDDCNKVIQDNWLNGHKFLK